jgi:hypothetical protein
LAVEAAVLSSKVRQVHHEGVTGTGREFSIWEPALILKVSFQIQNRGTRPILLLDYSYEGSAYFARSTADMKNGKYQVSLITDVFPISIASPAEEHKTQLPPNGILKIDPQVVEVPVSKKVGLGVLSPGRFLVTFPVRIVLRESSRPVEIVLYSKPIWVVVP